jgi:ribosomal protein S18 acetylase RimI-like enzyme
MRTIYADPIHWATVTLMDVTNSDADGWLITGVEVQKRFRGQGYASDLLDRVCEDADAEGVRLLLEISPDGTGLSDAALDAFYRRHGFEEWEDGDEGSRIREPRTE